MNGVIFNIKRFAVHDGPGIRTTVFFKGCPLRCAWCHNPESFNLGVSHGYGEIRSVEKIMREIVKEIIFFDESGGGVTFSGGEPMLQPQFLGALLDECRQNGVHTAVDTTGCISADIFLSLAPKIDLFLYDLKMMDDSLHRQFTGISNRLALENLQRLARMKKNVVIRFPVIPGVTDLSENVYAIGNFLAKLNTFRRIEMLPFHRLAEEKYRRLDLTYKMAGVRPPSHEQMKETGKIFRSFDLEPIIGG